MVKYNNILQETLRDSLVIVNRLLEDGEEVSASKVRHLLKEGKIEEALKYVPRETGFVLAGIAEKNMEIVNNILVDREKKARIIESYLKDYQVITLKANIVGKNKNIKEAYILISYFDRLISKYSIHKIVIDDYDGPCIIYLSNEKESLKEKMIEIEESNQLGRFVDIDVYYESMISLSRSKMRKCFLCDNPAFVCGRKKSHSVEELNGFLSKELEKYLCCLIYDLANQSMLDELNLDPKFGLVTPYTNGSHSDMDYNLMVKAKDAILEYFVEMFKSGYKSVDFEKTFKEIRSIGQKSEKEMFIKTSGVNAYKGLVFALGLVVCSIGIKLLNLKSKDTIFDYVKFMTKDITKEIDNFDKTNGINAYLQHNIKGARHQAESGYEDVKKVLERFTLDSNESKYEALIYLISNVDDTVLYKRCGNIEKYYYIKEKFKNLLNNNLNNENILELNKYCIDNYLSFGGSADLLIVCIFIRKFEKLFNLNLFI